MTFLLEESLEAILCARNLLVKLDRSDMVTSEWKGDRG